MTKVMVCIAATEASMSILADKARMHSVKAKLLETLTSTTEQEEACLVC